MMIFVSNSGQRQACNITLEGLSVGSNGASLHRIDSTHGNPVGLWEKWGSPAFPTPKQVGLLMQESENEAVRLSTVRPGDDKVMLSVDPLSLHVLVL